MGVDFIEDLIDEMYEFDGDWEMGLDEAWDDEFWGFWGVGVDDEEAE